MTQTKKATDLCAKLIQKPETFQRITGLSPKTFKEVVKKLTPIHRKNIKETKKLPGRPYGIKRLDNQLLCLLIYYRTYATQLFVSLFFQVDTATICRTIKRLEPILARVMKIKKERKMDQRTVHELIVDCTEQIIQRPQRRQKTYYSGKKKKHTMKTEMIVNKKGKICHISPPSPGSVHDLKIRRKGVKIPTECRLLADSGYQGFQKEHTNIWLPIRKPPRVELDRKAKKHNRQLGKERVSIEHRFAQMKVFQILSQVYRNPRNAYGAKTAIVAGLVNMKNGF